MSGSVLYTRISNFCGVLHSTTTYGSASYQSVVLIALSASIRLHPSHTQSPMRSYPFIHFNAQFSAHIHQRSCVLRISLCISAHPRLGPKHCLIWNQACALVLPSTQGIILSFPRTRTALHTLSPWSIRHMVRAPSLTLQLRSPHYFTIPMWSTRRSSQEIIWRWCTRFYDSNDIPISQIGALFPCQHSISARSPITSQSRRFPY